jgi:hypothetical protein
MIGTLMGRGFTQIKEDEIKKLSICPQPVACGHVSLARMHRRCVVDYPARVMESQGEIPRYPCLFIALRPLSPCPRVPVSVISRL